VEKKELDEELTELLEETAIVVTGGSFQTHKWSKVWGLSDLLCALKSE
jgi:hypothetical protein